MWKRLIHLEAILTCHFLHYCYVLGVIYSAVDQLNLFPDVVVVSGASRGIGRELVNLLFGSGFDVVTLPRQVCNSVENLSALGVVLSDEARLPRR